MRSYLSLSLGVTASLASVALLSADAHAGGLGVFGAAGDTSSVAEEYLPVSHPDYEALDTKRTGSATVGLQWKVWGDPSKFQLIATTLMGAGFVTTDNTEFAIFQPGFGATYTFNERYQLVGSVNYNARFRKTLKSGGEALVGFRYMID